MTSKCALSFSVILTKKGIGDLEMLGFRRSMAKGGLLFVARLGGDPKIFCCENQKKIL